MRNRNIYVVDDDSAIRSSLFFALTSLGYPVRSLSSGQEFFDNVATLHPGCVLLDLGMPGIDGIEVIEALGSRLATLPVILMTGNGDIPIAVRAMKLGASDFLEKPFDQDQLVEAIERVFVDLFSRADSTSRRQAAKAALDRLTQRENDILDCLAAGQANKVIAHELGLSIRTVEMYRSSMMTRLGVRSLPEAIRIKFDAATEPANDSGPDSGRSTGRKA